MLPTNEYLLCLADICHNYFPNRRYDTLAVGAVGHNHASIELVVGINSCTFDEIKLNKDRTIPKRIQEHPFLRSFNLKFLCEPYHAETSVILYACDNNFTVFGLASSRKICPICDHFLTRHQHKLDPNCYPVDSWWLNGRLLTQEERQAINDLSFPAISGAVAARAPR